MNRKERRAAKADNRRYTKHIKGFDQKVINLARLYNLHEDLLEEDNLSEILDNPNLDDALDKNATAIGRELINVDAMAFKAELLHEACRKNQITFDTNDLHTASDEEVDFQSMEFNVFAIPLDGSLAAMDELMNPENLNVFAKTFRQCGLASDQSNILVFPILIDQVQAVQIMPGQLRSLVNDFIAFTDYKHEISYMSLIKNFKHTLVDSNRPLRQENSITVGQRIMLVLHMSNITEALHDEDKNDQNYLSRMRALASPLSALNIEFLEHEDDPHPALAKWVDTVDELTSGPISFDTPTTFPRACAVMATNRIFTALQTEAAMLGLDASEEFDEITMKEDDDVYTFTASLDGHILGPVDTSMISIGYDRDYFSDVLTEMTGSLRIIENGANDPAPSMTRH